MTTLIPTTPAPTTVAPTTPDPASQPVIACARRFVAARGEVVVRAWVEDQSGELLPVPLSMANSVVGLYSENVKIAEVPSQFEDPAGTHVLLFRLPTGLLYPGHAYFLRVHLVTSDGITLGVAEFAMGTT